MALVAVLLSLVLGGLVAVPAPAAPNDDYTLTPAYVGDPMHLPILMYRQRHTVMANDVTWDRNVAAFDYYPAPGLRLVMVGPNVANWWNSKPTAPLDVYWQNPQTGAWSLVDTQGKPLTANGKPVDWRTTSTPSVLWDLSTDPDPTILDKGPHSEWIVSLYLELKLGGLDDTTTEGLSERIPCESPGNDCRSNLANGNLFGNLVNMRYLTAAPNAKKAAEQKVVSASDELAQAQKLWSDAKMPTGWDAAARLGSRSFVTPGSPAPQGSVAGVLGPRAPPLSPDLGGIDFSTLELRYLTEAPGGQLRYAFSATPGGAKGNVADGQLAATQSSDAFFVWLNLRQQTFWVNLNPSEPDRIIDPALGRTDVGRILLEADFRMKRVVGELIHPDTDLGKRFWGSVAEAAGCIDMRQWIVPAPATVYEDGGGLYIVDAPLEVKMETEHFKEGDKTSSCVTPDAAMETRFRTLVLPKVQERVNKAADFAELRRVYLSRVAAEWYRQRHAKQGTLSDMIDSGNVGAWPALHTWSPRQVFDRYVEAFNKKEFDVTRQETYNGSLYERTYSYGGVDFSEVLLNRVSQSQFQKDYQSLPGTVDRSVRQHVTDAQGKLWLGGVSEPVPLPDFLRPPPATSNPLFYPLILLPFVGWAVVGGWLVIQRMRRRRNVTATV